MKRRFYSRLDMAILKKDISIVNAKRNRGEIANSNNQTILVCGCGATGCFIHSSFEYRNKSNN